MAGLHVPAARPRGDAVRPARGRAARRPTRRARARRCSWARAGSCSSRTGSRRRRRPRTRSPTSIAANVEHPSNELLLGAPGTMLAARAMHARTGEERFAELWRASARTLLARQDADGLWTQDLYGRQRRHIGAAHGFAGNVLRAVRRARVARRRRRCRGSRRRHGARARARRRRPARTGRRSRTATRLTRRRACSGATAPPASSRRWPRVAPGDDASRRAAGRRRRARLAGPVRSRATPASVTARPATASRSSRCCSAPATSAGSRRARAFATHALEQVDRFRAARAAAATRSSPATSARRCSRRMPGGRRRVPRPRRLVGAQPESQPLRLLLRFVMGSSAR